MLAEEKPPPLNPIFLGLVFPFLCVAVAGIGGGVGSLWALLALLPLCAMGSMWGKSLKRGWTLTASTLAVTTDWFTYGWDVSSIEQVFVDQSQGIVMVKSRGGEVVTFRGAELRFRQTLAGAERARARDARPR